MLSGFAIGDLQLLVPAKAILACLSRVDKAPAKDVK